MWGSIRSIVNFLGSNQNFETLIRPSPNQNPTTKIDSTLILSIMSSFSSRFLRISATKNLKMELGSSSSRKSRNSGHKLCFYGLKASINQAWTDKNSAVDFTAAHVLKYEIC